MLVEMTYSCRVESGFQSGTETQFLFSEGDIRESDADALTSQPTAGKFVIPRFIRLLCIIQLTERFSVSYFHRLDLLTRRFGNDVSGIGPVVSFAETSVVPGDASLPADLSVVVVQPLSASTHPVGGATLRESVPGASADGDSEQKSTLISADPLDVLLSQLFSGLAASTSCR